MSQWFVMNYMWIGILLIVVGAVVTALSTAYLVDYGVRNSTYSEEIDLRPGLAYRNCFFIRGDTNVTAQLYSNGTYVFIIYGEHGDVLSNTTMAGLKQYIGYTFDKDSSYCFLFINNGNKSIFIKYTFTMSSHVISEKYPFLTATGITAVLAGIILAFYRLLRRQEEYPPVIRKDLVECQAVKLNKHRCSISIEPNPGVEHVVLDYYRGRGFTVRSRLGKCYFLRKHGRIYGKNIDLLVCFTEDKIVFEYRLSPLLASGSIDLKAIYNEVHRLYTRLAEKNLFHSDKPAGS